ncbi:Major facilitator superfamily domain, general substrate transporter [Metarhizium rileyi]|uniref:Major facilitator superfamily domain, general substrate transporter n=1 Tax=Metarhizium rileyi (strain RCEF 4871) TaxID=1649241 RepID=A0A167DBR5_METRR|nr:Major facilitator superfamily domain, general substrate transporter [Metarhizium rileyi RCEF 4871]
MSADLEKRQPERPPEEIERQASTASAETTETATARDVEKGALPAGPVPSVSTSGEGTGAEADSGAAVVRRMASRASTTRSKAVTIVPLSERRGLFARLAITPEVERPYEYRNSTKWGITATIALATLAAPMGSSIFYPALHGLTVEFNTSSTVVNLSVALYMLSMSIFPLWWSSFSEEYGRRSIYLVSFMLFVVFSVLCAVSQNIAMLIVFRVLTGGASASVQAVGAGTIADIWESFERGRAMSMFYLGPLLGPIISPVLGGVLSQNLGWRACMYFLAIYGLCVVVMLLLFLPETLAKRKDETEDSPVLQRMSTRESARVRSERFAKGLKRFLVDPLAVLLFLRFPPVLITVCLAAIAFGALFVANISIQQEFRRPPYGFQQIIVGLLYFPPGIGYFLASVFGGRWIDSIMAREAARANRYDEHGKLILLPEDRMRENMWLANTVYPCGLLLFGWTLHYGVFWFVPSIGSFLFGVSSMLVFSTATTMLTEFVRKRSSAGVAVNNFVRNILSCVGTIVAAPWVDAIGVGYVMTIVALFCLAAGYFGIWTLRRNAPRWRKEMDRALNGDD